MTYAGKFNIELELLKVVRGQKTKLPAALVLHEALHKRPRLQKRVAQALGITR